MKTLRHFLFMGIAFLSLFVVTGCNKDDEGGGDAKGLKGWYANSKDINGGICEWMDDLARIERDAAQLFGGTPQGLEVNSRGEVYVAGDKFDDTYIVYNIENSNTIVKYFGHVLQYGASAASGETLLFKFNNSTLGTLALYGYTFRYYTYSTSDNKIWSDEPEIFTITSNGLIPDGSSIRYIKYDQDKTY
jgi:hypothetical protein